MAYKFICEPIRKTDEHGDIQSLGINWTEDTTRRTGPGLVHRIYALLIMVAVTAAALLFVGDRWFGGTALFILAFSAPGTLLGIYFIARPFTERSIEFRCDGAILAPKGLPKVSGSHSIDFPHSEIGRIDIGSSPEKWYADPTLSVRFITNDGRTIYVGEKLTEPEARQVAVNLTLMLNELRGKDADHHQVVSSRVENASNPDDEIID